MIKFSQLLIVCLSFCLFLAANQALAQDAVYVNKIGGGTTRVTGKISAVDPEGVNIDDKRIKASEIRRIAVGKEPSAINRLRDEMVGGQYADCLASIEKLGSVDEPFATARARFHESLLNCSALSDARNNFG